MFERESGVDYVAECQLWMDHEAWDRGYVLARGVVDVLLDFH